MLKCLTNEIYKIVSHQKYFSVRNKKIRILYENPINMSYLSAIHDVFEDNHISAPDVSVLCRTVFYVCLACAVLYVPLGFLTLSHHLDTFQKSTCFLLHYL